MGDRLVMCEQKLGKLVSVVIPVYNVEEYVSGCVGSVTAQTYDNLEIILVDDGATDNSGRIVDEWAERDSRIRVVHKKNGGLSDARNAGIEIAKGEFVTFIDSDDLVGEGYVESLLAPLANDESVDIACLNGFIKFDGGRMPKARHGGPAFYLGQRDALMDMLYMNNTTHSAWGKIYRAGLFDDVRYPKGHNYEDAATTYKLFLRSRDIAIVDYDGYFYRDNASSITHRSFSKERMDGLRYVKEQLDAITVEYPYDKELIRAAIFRYMVEALYILESAYGHGKNKKYIDMCVAVLDKYKWSMVINRHISVRYNIKFTMMCVIGVNITLRLLYNGKG